MEELLHVAYSSELPPGYQLDDLINVRWLACWHESNLSLFPQTLPTNPTLPNLLSIAEPTYRILRYLIRDFIAFLAELLLYQVEVDLLSAANRYFFACEKPEVLYDILAYEANTRCHYEQGIRPTKQAFLT